MSRLLLAILWPTVEGASAVGVVISVIAGDWPHAVEYAQTGAIAYLLWSKARDDVRLQRLEHVSWTWRVAQQQQKHRRAAPKQQRSEP